MAETDFPLAEIETICERAIQNGGFILQKWTCAGCGQRLTGSNINVLVHKGHCQHCNTFTDLDQRGCNFALIQTSRSDLTAHDLDKILGLVEPARH